MGTSGNKKNKFLGMDIGTKRIGIAITDSSKKIAFPYEVIPFKDENLLLIKIRDIIVKENIEKIIIGDPINIQGQRSTLTGKIYEIIEFLKKNLNIDIELYDERYSTKTAHKDLRTANINYKRQKKIIDKIAAAIILKNYLENN